MLKEEIKIRQKIHQSERRNCLQEHFHSLKNEIDHTNVRFFLTSLQT